MRSAETVSVIIPTWNRGQQLINAVKSALEQTLPPLEILICDDGSTDGSIESVTATFPDRVRDGSIRILKNPRTGGPAVPRNAGIRAAKGNWLAFLDSDDVWKKGKLEVQLRELKQYPTAIACCTNATRVINGEAVGTYFSTATSKSTVFTWKDLRKGNPIICSSMLVLNSVQALNLGFPETPEFKAIEDFALWMRVAAEGNVLFVNQLLVEYADQPQTSIRKDDSLSGQEVNEKVFRFFMSTLSPAKKLKWAAYDGSLSAWEKLRSKLKKLIGGTK